MSLFAFSTAVTASAVVAATVACGYAITGDAEVVDRFAAFERQGGVCARSDTTGADAALRGEPYRWRQLALALQELRATSGRVRYGVLPTDPELMDALELTAAQLAVVDPNAWGSHEEKLSFWINAYNALVLYAASKAFVEDVEFRVDQNDFAFFDREIHVIGGRVISLNQLENGVLRGDRTHRSLFFLSEEQYAPIDAWHRSLWGTAPVDPRIHFALNCASSSCPDLDIDPLKADGLYDRLDALSARFLEDPTRGAGPEGISQIFDFYAIDFEASGGIPAFISRYRVLDDVDTGRFLPYDWSLNLDATPDPDASHDLDATQ